MRLVALDRLFLVRVNLPSYALQPRNDTAVGAHCGRADQGGRNGAAQPESIGRARGGGRGRVRVGEHG